MTGRHARPKTRANRMPRVRVLAAITAFVLALTVITPKPEATEAAWTDGELTSSTLAANTLLPPSNVSCSVGRVLIDGLLQQAVTVTWSPPSTGAAPQTYHVTLTPSAGSVGAPQGTYSTRGSETSISVPTSTLIGLGSSSLKVYSRAGSEWSSAAGSPVRTVNVISLVVGVSVKCQ